MRKESTETAEQTARRLRQRLGIDHLTWIDPMTVLRKLVELIPGFCFALVDAATLDGKLARWDSDKKRIQIREDVFYAANERRREGRARYSIFHEVVHALEGHRGQLNRDTSRANIPSYARKLKELESNTDKITAAFMAPRHLVSPNETAEQIESRFGLSRQAAKIRWEELHGRSSAGRKLPPHIRDMLDGLE